jgi:hypothetical protein
MLNSLLCASSPRNKQTIARGAGREEDNKNTNRLRKTTELGVQKGGTTAKIKHGTYKIIVA